MYMYLNVPMKIFQRYHLQEWVRVQSDVNIVFDVIGVSPKQRWRKLVLRKADCKLPSRVRAGPEVG